MECYRIRSFILDNRIGVCMACVAALICVFFFSFFASANTPIFPRWEKGCWSNWCWCCSLEGYYGETLQVIHYLSTWHHLYAFGVYLYIIHAVSLVHLPSSYFSLTHIFLRCFSFSSFCSGWTSVMWMWIGWLFLVQRKHPSHLTFGCKIWSFGRAINFCVISLAGLTEDSRGNGCKWFLIWYLCSILKKSQQMEEIVSVSSLALLVLRQVCVVIFYVLLDSV